MPKKEVDGRGGDGGDQRREAERFVRTYSDLILRLSYTYLHSTYDAQDVCQTVFLKMLTRRPQFEGEGHERAWVIRVTANACKDLLRRADKRVLCLDDVAEPPAPDDGAHERQTVLDAVMSLPEAYREVVYLHYFEGYPIRDVARLVNVGEAAATKRLSRARDMLRERIGDSDD
ncbi:RNA polymerase, sigma-24 subunit, ECF subfamily [Olsenella uli DSM 7084]|uniref:RNA polymerase, sigma-24 subunit, ECF subfamily n=1 Tax=Olsenella uli (strain ATCC 49627 / DSM 7084 / CCUG 31166 / CIP 109912 / JCM 12494 / LMG 11480 / NCIMB 702895 / VPI D76D-27C) TaxID=633147 RepID=E1QZR4_OLSUV|nr:sigma-70 family RNA polymerase sigma factor [Olsenella uli]ADK67878.1 RNA polymerase, sigma-24 subunit, ECF subfamily [Olsenella uli DSM 7084]KRO13329.1 ECF subfamily RNA polymerase sigma-24 subunit [Olsenella uli DSM 7084]MBS6418338.1 sigma-70 family RNA polymerase sigma factor [Olsenella uli]